METHYITVETKFGKIVLIPTQADHIYATTEPGYGKAGSEWTIRGKVYHYIAVHLYKHSDGQWHVGNEQGQHGTYSSELTAHAKKLVESELVRVVNEWAKGASRTFDKAEVEHLTTEIDRAMNARNELENQVANLTHKINVLTAKRNQIVVEDEIIGKGK